MLSEDMIKQFINAGIPKQQANSSTADAIANFFMNEDEKTLIREARIQVSGMSDLVSSLRSEYRELKKKMEDTAGFLVDIAESQEEYGAFTDERARNAVALYASILKMNERTKAEGKYSIRAASYAIYAYLNRSDNHNILDVNSRDDDEESASIPFRSK